MKNKRALIAAALLILLAVPVFAATVSVEWQWVKNDPAVQYFRYQVDAQNENSWIVVPANVTSYTRSGLDGSRSYTLYLQQSYDGVHWSSSSSVSSEPLPEVVPPPVASEIVTETTVVPPAEPAVVEEPAAPVVEEPAPVTEPEVVETLPIEEEASSAPAPVVTPVPVDEPSSFHFNLGFAGGVVLDNIGGPLDLAADAQVQFGFEDIVEGFDIKLNIGAIANPSKDISFDNFYKLDTYYKSIYADLLAGGSFEAGISEFYFGLGARLRLDWGSGQEGLFSFSEFAGFVQPTANVGMRFNFTDWFNIAIEGQYVMDLGDFKDISFDTIGHSITPRLVLGFAF